MPEEKSVDNTTETNKFWSTEVAQAESFRRDWAARSWKIVRRYRDDDRLEDTRGGIVTSGNTGFGLTRYNILYANTDTLIPVLYNETPIADVRANIKTDKAARKAAGMLEEALNYSIGSMPFNSILLASLTDSLLAGLGQVRVKYMPFFRDSLSEEQEAKLEEKEKREEEVEEATGVEKEEDNDEVVFEQALLEYVNWDDFIFPNERWDDMPWIAYRGRVTKEEAAEMFGAVKAERLNYTSVDVSQSKENRSQKPEGEDKATIFEIWDKESRTQIFIGNNANDAPLLVQDDPLGLEGFFPSPRPMTFIGTGDNPLPVPLYAMYADQAIELDNVTDRITKLIDNLRRRGVYNSSLSNKMSQLINAGDNRFIPIDDWTELQNKGGLDGAMQSEDLTPFIGALTALYNQRNEILRIIFQTIGISDIQRAATDPTETASAQRIKSKFGMLRVSKMQREVQRFVAEAINLLGEVIINNFEAETVSTITGIQEETEVKIDEQTGEVSEVIVGTKDLLDKVKDQNPSTVVVDIETDSTITKDDIVDKDMMAEFAGVITQFAERAPLLSATIGQDATGEMMKMLVRRFKLGRNVEQAIDDRLEELKTNPPDQGVSEGEATVQAAQIEAQARLQSDQIDAQVKQAELQLKAAELQLEQQALEIKMAEIGLKNNIEQQKIDLAAVKTSIEGIAIAAEAQSPGNDFVGV